MKLLFVKASLGWPRTLGNDVYCYEMMRALAGLGHEVLLATQAEPEPRALEGLSLTRRWTLDPAPDTGGPVAMSYLQERYRRYWGTEKNWIAALQRIVDETRPDAVAAFGLEILPYLAGARGPVRVWGAGDEWALHHLSQVAADPRAAWDNLKAAATKGLYERAFGPAIDRIWVVSDVDQRAMRWVAGVRHVDLIPNGVDSEMFAPQTVEERPSSAVFWGRLGFGPNVQGLRWFCTRVWPIIRTIAPDATFSILGFDPPEEVQRLDGRNGIRVLANLPDLRPEVGRHAVAVLPLISGAGIKNKLLEAAALGKAIVCTPKACVGLRTPPPAIHARTPREFAEGVLSLWAQPTLRRELGAAARQWVQNTHTWTAAAREAIAGLEESLRERRLNSQ